MKIKPKTKDKIMTNTPFSDEELIVELYKQHPELIEKFLESGENNFHVFTQSRGMTALVQLYIGKNQNKAMEVANFWDERMNTYYIKTSQIVQGEKNRRARMSPEARIQEDVDAALARIDEMTETFNQR